MHIISRVHLTLSVLYGRPHVFIDVVLSTKLPTDIRYFNQSAYKLNVYLDMNSRGQHKKAIVNITPVKKSKTNISRLIPPLDSADMIPLSTAFE